MPLSQAALSEADPAPTKRIKAKINFLQLRVAGFLTHCDWALAIAPQVCALVESAERVGNEP
jgi:hypothetical protein